ncbi:MAG: NHLP family bacteriocin export ABC transporter peptidase/permease/ATPase subunit [Gammaproteobacteria bacterium]|nr:NHLP family bacteriocin export ABC transporter peptidase/permease/ATPase subunit [Gammaproteobacteria bacterium]
MKRSLPRLRRPSVGPVRTPTILQMEALECGAASLAMVLAYYGRWVPLEELRVLCGVSRDGSKAVNLLKAARSLGLEASGKRMEPQELAKLSAPAILFVNMNHFVVFEGMVKTGFQINDPAGGRRRVTPEAFDGMFTGIVLVFKPGDCFQPGGAAPSMLPSLLAMARHSLQPLSLLVLAGLLLAMMNVLLPGLQRVYLDRILIEQIDNWTYPLVIALAVITPLVAVLTWLHGQLVATLAAKLSIVLSSRLVWRVLRLPVLFFTQRYAGTISSRVALADQLVVTLSESLSEALIQGGLLLLLTALMLQYSPVLTLIAIGVTLFNVLLFQRLRKAMGEASEKVTMQLVKMSGKAMQGLRMMETLKSTGTDSFFFSRWAGLQVLYLNAQQEITLREALIQSLQTWLASLLTAVVLVVGGYFTMVEHFSIGMLVAFSTITVLFNQQVTVLVNLAGTLQQTKGIISQLDDTLRYPPAWEFRQVETAASDDRIVPATTEPLRRLTGKVRIEGLAFGYAPLDPPLIQDFSLEVLPGSRVALVGGSGSGKSTVGKLITGLLEPQAGSIYFDDRLLEEIPRDILRNSLAVVDQEIILFEGSMRDNISLWDETLPQEQLVSAAKDAMIHDVILSRRGGYDAQLEENGRNLSGGQRQRLELARALAGNPTLLVLDEATSALDTLTEQAIMDNLRRRGCTCFIIAHRLSTIRDCDEIIVMHRGRTLQRGTHTELMAEDGPYRRLIET